MRARIPPIVVPMWITGKPSAPTVLDAISENLALGFDEIMHEDRQFPRFLPRLGRNVSITFGDPTHITKEANSLISRWRSSGPHDKEWTERSLKLEAMEHEGRRITTMNKAGVPYRLEIAPADSHLLERPETIETRIELTAILQSAVKKLGDEVERHNRRN
jgi:hypothetical protein